jgi:hypothetical protein
MLLLKDLSIAVVGEWGDDSARRRKRSSSGHYTHFTGYRTKGPGFLVPLILKFFMIGCFGYNIRLAE